MGIADKIRDTAEDLKDKAQETFADAKNKMHDATSKDEGEAGVGEDGQRAASTVDPGAAPGRTSETRNATVESPKIQGL